MQRAAAPAPVPSRGSSPICSAGKTLREEQHMLARRPVLAWTAPGPCGHRHERH